MNLTYKQLQAELKTARSNGLPLNVKLNAKHEVLQAEYERIQAVRGDFKAITNETVFESSMSFSSPALIVYKPFAPTDEPELQAVEESVPFKTMRRLVPDSFIPSFMKRTVKEYKHGVDVFFPYEYTGQYSEFTCDVLSGQFTELACQLPEDYYLRGQYSKLHHHYYMRGQTCELPVDYYCKWQRCSLPVDYYCYGQSCPLPKPVAVSSAPTNSRMQIGEKLDPTCLQALENGKHFLKCLKAFCIGFNEGLKAKRR